MLAHNGALADRLKQLEQLLADAGYSESAGSSTATLPD